MSLRRCASSTDGPVMIHNLLNSALGLGATFTLIGVPAVFHNKGPVDVRHPFELRRALDDEAVS